MPKPRIGGYATVVEEALTVDTNAYATGDLIGGKITLENAALIDNLNPTTGIIQSVVITDLAKQSVALDVVFWDTDPSNTTFTDNSALDISDTDLPNLIGVASVTSWFAFNDSSAGQALNLSIPFQVARNQHAIYAAIVSRGAPTYGASDLTLRVGIFQD